MNNSRKIVGLYRIGLSCTKKSAIAQFQKQILFIHPTHNFLCNFKAFDTINMAQKSITSFFKATPKKSIEPQEETTKDESSPSLKDKAAEELSPKANGNEKSNSKRRRLESSEDESQSPEPNKKKASTNSDQKKKSKRQRIESSESEPEVPKTEIKVEKSESPKTYDSPKTKKAKIKLEKSTPKRQSKEKNEGETPKRKSPKDKNECETLKSPISEKDVITPKSKSKGKDKTPESTSKTNAGSPKSPVKRSISPSEKVASDKSKENKTEKKIVTLSGFVKKENGVKETEDEKDSEKVKEEDYNPAKPKYHPINDACWSKGQPIPYLALAKTMEAIEAISARLKIIEILSNYFRSVIALTPEDLLPSVYMCLNQLAPAYYSLELGIAETYIMKAIGQCTGRTLAQVKSAAQKTGDLGLVAEQARATQRTMFTPPPLKLRQVFAVLKEVANMTGQASVNKKISKIQTLYIACRHSEARYLIRSLEGKLRIGLAEQSVLQALALATTMTPPGICIETLDASKGLTAEQFKEKVDKQALIIKTTYCECPNYDMIIPALLEHGVAALPDHCKLTPGIPLKPMLAHPTKGLNEVFNRFENQQFTCEWKYDGERAQIHVPGVMFPDYVHSAIFSRNQENNTTKYPDILKRLPKLLKEDVNSCVLDTEAVAYDVEKKQILPFQILSTRKRKDAVEADIKVQVCVFVFDLLYLNGRALVREPLAVRRELLRKHFNEVEGEWHFATSKDCTSMEEVQVFLDESIRGSCEGLMVKMLQGENARYDIARRSHNWLKLKKDYLDGVGDTIDAVIIGAYAGKGKRAGVYGGFLLACADSSGEEYQTLCKIGTGFSDEDLKTLTELLKQHVIDSPKSYYRFDSSHAADVWLAPACVAEVRCADLSLSPAHRAAIGLVDPDKGISLRFPRFIRIRDDKTPEQATSSQQIAEMYLSQDQVKNTGTKVTNYDDFY